MMSICCGLHRILTDVDKLLDALERVIGFHHLSDEVEEKIKRGLVWLHNVALPTYLL